ncbi:Ca(2+)-dependent cysteine protease [Thoreauomyces humboldtii]|nr:Ca(2+)-dependent cysteine protease [Thoreauomyces humboldtii]
MSFFSKLAENLDKLPMDKISGLVEQQFGVKIPGQGGSNQEGQQQQQSSSQGQYGQQQQQGGYGGQPAYNRPEGEYGSQQQQGNYGGQQQHQQQQGGYGGQPAYNRPEVEYGGQQQQGGYSGQPAYNRPEGEYGGQQQQGGYGGQPAYNRPEGQYGGQQPEGHHHKHHHQEGGNNEDGYQQQQQQGQYNQQPQHGRSNGGQPPPPVQGQEEGIQGAPTIGYHHASAQSNQTVQQQPLDVPEGTPAAQQWGTQTSGGKRRALFIGINYVGQQSELKGCINDVRNVHQWLTSNYPFHENLILTDDNPDPTRKPTRQNLLNAFKWLVEGAAPNDAFFMHYSGHGSQQKDVSGLEKDGLSETIVPLDYQTAGQITDEELFNALIKPLPQGSRLTTIFDCCHSGSVLNLPFTYTVDGSLDVIVRDNRSEAIKAGVKIGMALFQKDNATAFREAKDLFSMLTSGGSGGDNPQQDAANRDKYSSAAHVVQLSGCQDSQTSADASIGGEATGAMSWALLKTLQENNHKMTYTQVLRETRQSLQGKYKQIPQLSTGHQFDVNTVLFSVI